MNYLSNKLGFLGIEYSGHGKSSGKFTNGNISRWTNEVKFVINKIVKKNNFILVGSSMGAWLAINQFKFFNNQKWNGFQQKCVFQLIGNQTIF